MTEQQAINGLNLLFSEHGLNLPCTDSLEILNIAIKALEEIQQYREIGTVEECREAREKQKALSPVTYTGTNRADCSVCGATVRGIGKPFGNWCANCGQKLDWSEKE